ncbi:hypothetical protein MAR_021191 [Mya arenaria]|uniref:Uncharacterized protein n=1 Tax=Mya arenaria TaxID=6604 RepID=A0ABY7EA58_MYAAR|nr:hypothetical protein MAR_021191 [Mya arenaria]
MLCVTGLSRTSITASASLICEEIQECRLNDTTSLIFSSKAYNKGVCAENLIHVHAFRKTGVFPRRKSSISAAKTSPSAIYTIDHTDDHRQSTDKSQSRKILKVVETLKKQDNGIGLEIWPLKQLQVRVASGLPPVLLHVILSVLFSIMLYVLPLAYPSITGGSDGLALRA